MDMWIASAVLAGVLGMLNWEGQNKKTKRKKRKCPLQNNNNNNNNNNEILMAVTINYWKTQ